MLKNEDDLRVADWGFKNDAENAKNLHVGALKHREERIEPHSQNGVRAADALH